MPARKTFARFMPPPRLGLEEAERHYTRVHVPLARRVLAEHAAITSYSAIRATGQLDANGGWEAHASAWRFAVQRFEPTAPLHSVEALKAAALDPTLDRQISSIFMLFLAQPVALA